jgi:hypothetical protein
MTSLEPSPKSVVASLFEPYGLPLLAQDDNNTSTGKKQTNLFNCFGFHFV